MKKKFLLFILLTGFLALLLIILRLRMRPAPPIDPEFTRLAALIDKYKTEDVQVVSEGLREEPAIFLNFAKDFVKRSYDHGQTAVDWVKENCCTTRGGNTLYFKYPDGSTRPMREVFLEELETR